ncbi:lysosomal-trafficking regulator isoform X2 [Thrips palmi]|uniref:Lysosomal-trafficking regulator isoform X2 n=1 Tax=Thrips palmi TaxID=161013 RepID=A0A6P8ZY94_THRPL|nr:lysosomal-trafficking regulator isoform X2 [Thrips palmi]
MSQQFSSKIQALWEKFLQAECASYERSTWFDGFLTQFLVEFKDGSTIHDILPFTPLAGVATLIGCELLSDVHQICSQPGDGEDLAPLRRHFLLGRGWRTLAVLHCLGVQDVSCGTELATLLISLYPVCLQPQSHSRKVSTSTVGSKSHSCDESSAQQGQRNPYVALSGCWHKGGCGESSGNSSPGACSSHGHRGYSLPGLLKISPSDGIHYRKWSTSSRPGSIGTVAPQQSRSDQMKSHSSSSLSKQKRRSRNCDAESPRMGGSAVHTVTSESEAPQDASEVLLNKSNTLKIRLDPMDFDYFESVIRSDDESNGDQPRWRYSMKRATSKLTAEDLTDDRMREVRTQTINSAEFSLLVVHLLEELCRAELLISTQQVSLQSVNFALENLCSLQFGSTPLDSLLAEEVIELKLAMTQLLLTALDKVLVQSEIINQLINAGVLPVMLRVLEDAVRKAESFSKVDSNSPKLNQNQTKASLSASSKSSSKSVESDVLDEICGLQEFVMGILYGAVTFLHCLLLHRSSTERIHEFEEQFRLFASSYGGRLVEKTVMALVNCGPQVTKNSVNRGRKVVYLVVQLILSLKQARSTIVHSLQCRKTRHKHCKSVDARRHHHNDLFGNPFGSVSARNVGVGHHSSSCNVSYLFAALVRILNSNSHLSEFCVPVMRVMLDCGTCCCYPAKSLLSCLIKILKTGNAKARALGFTLLEHTVFTELGATETPCAKPLKEYFRCSVCNRSVESLSAQPSPLDDSQDDLLRAEDPPGKDLSKDSEKMSSLSVSSGRSESSESKQYNWSCLDFYRELLCSDDPKLCHTAASHLLKLSPRCSEKVQIALLSNVFYPSFVQAKRAYIAHQKDVSKFIVLSCLSAFSCLMSSLPLAETFLTLGGLEHLLDLMVMPPFLRVCCSVLEVVIVVDILEAEKSSQSSKLGRNEMKQAFPLPAMLLPSQRLSQMTSLAKLIECLEMHSNDLLDKMENEEEGLDDYLNTNSANRRAHLKLLHHVILFWQTVANLSLCSPQLRPFFACHSISSLGFVLLRATLLKLINSSNWKRLTSNRDTESFLYMRLIESVLVFHLTSPPVNDQTGLPTSREKLIDNLKSTLCNVEVLSLSERSPSNAGSLRRLCDVLIRCALAEASTEQVLPALRKAKLPILMVPDIFPEEVDEMGDTNDEESLEVQVSADNNQSLKADHAGVSDEGSSIEDPYVTADEGYEADIEVLENKTNGMSVTYDSSTSGSLGIHQNYTGLGEAGKSNSVSDKKFMNVISYPRLCSVSINLLVYLYQELQNLYSEEPIESEELVESTSQTEQDVSESINAGNNRRQILRDRLKEKRPTLKSQLLSDMVHVVQRIVALCRESGKNCMVLSREGVIDILLTGFSTFLLSVNSELAELQSVVLELVALLAQHSITSLELSKYLHFFKGENPPLESLLQPLTTLVTNARPQPNFILCFPVMASPFIGLSGSDAELGNKSVSESPQRKISGLLSLAANIGVGSNGRNSSNPEVSKSSSETSRSQNAAINMAQSIRCLHLASKTPSAWSECALALPIDTDLGWCAWLSGFSISLWLRLERSAAPESTVPQVDHPAGLHRNYSGHLSDSLSDSWSEWGVVSSASWLKEGIRSSNNSELRGHLHVLSIGTDNLMLEVWADVSSDRLHLKLRRSDAKTNDILAESVTESILPPGQWHHLAFNVHDYILRKKSVIEVTIIINGLREIKCPLQFNGIVLRKPKPTCLLVGHSVQFTNGLANTTPLNLSHGHGSWYLGNLQLFRCPVFNRERAVYLVGLGPSHTSLTDCKVGRDSPNFTNIFGAKILNSGVAWDAVLDNGVVNLKELQDNLLISYSAQNPLTMNVYPQIVGSSGAGMGSLFPGQPGFRVVTPDQRASQQLPLAIKPIQYGPLNTQQYRGLISAVSTLGGAHVFLFLFARVVELKANEVEQGKALFLLLKLVQSDTSLFSQFVQEDCHKLLLKVLASQRCIPGHHMLKAVLDACCDKPVLQHQPGPQCLFRVVHQSEAIVVNSFLLSTIVGSWRDWERVGVAGEEGGVLGTLFRALHVLLRDDHPFREFNASQFNRVRLVEALLLFCKERFLYEEWQPLHPSVCCSLVELVRSLMGAPPEFSHVVAVADCLLLLHPASATYITHVRPSYYFLLSPSPPSASPQLQPRSKIRSGLFEHGGKEKKNQTLNKKKALSVVKREHAGGFGQPVDPSKLNKALTNLQIKRNTDEVQNGRNSYMSSSTNQNLDVIDSNKVEEGSEANASDFDADLVEGCDELTAFDSGIAGSFRDQAGSSDADVRESHSDDKESTNQKELHDRADLLMMQAEEEKFTTEMNLNEKQFVKDWSKVSPSQKDRGRSSNTETSTRSGNPPISSNNSLCLVVEGLLLLLRDTLLVLPDNMASQVLNHVVQAETLLVMTNNSDARVRSAVVKVLGAFLQRATEEEISKFSRMKGFYQLASQLGLYPATSDLIESCATLVTQRGDTSIEELLVSLTEQLDLDQLSMSPLQLSAFPPLLGLLPRAIHDVALTHNTLAFVKEVLQQVRGAMKPLLEAGLLEVLLKMLVLVAHQPPEPTDIVGTCTQDLLISDINIFLLSIMSLALSTPGNQSIQILNDIQLQLTFLHQLESSSCGKAARCVSVLQDAHCTILDGTLSLLIEKLSSHPNQMKGQSLLSASYDDKLGWTRALDSGHLRVPVMSLSLSHHSSFSSQSGSLLRTKPLKDVSRSELYERFKIVVEKAVEFFTYSEPRDESLVIFSEVEQTFARRLFATLLEGLCSVVDRRSVDSKSLWSGAMWAARDTLRVRSAQLFVWLLTPWQPLKMRMFTIHSLRSEPRAKELITSMLHTRAPVEQKFTVWLWALMYGQGVHQLQPADFRACEELKEQLQRWGVLSPHAIGHSHDNWEGEVTLLLREAERQRLAFVAHSRDAMEKSVHKMEHLHRTLVDGAMTATRSVVEAQNSERKVFMEHIKGTFNENVQLRLKWQQLIQLLTHERAVWFFPESYPMSWQLDATEGPARVRKRLQRCHLHIKDKFLLPEHQEKLEHVRTPAPLQYLFERDPNASSTSTSSVMIDRLHTNEKIQFMCAAHIITPACEIPGELLIGESSLYFVVDDSVESGRLDISSTAWQFEDVKEIINRRFQLQERALEIFLLNGRTYLVAFQTAEERDAFLLELAQCELVNRMQGENLSDVLEMWREGTISDWEYLTQLNKMAGRSYNDLMQYPVFPFVLADYTSASLDLNDAKSFRNFKKPMAIQNKCNEQHYIDTYNYVKQELSEGLDLAGRHEPYHYGSHYSNSGIVLHFLVRLPPFTGMFLHYQDDNFDLPDRTFHSLHTTWRLTSSDSTTDVKEMIPEFYFLQEFLVNYEGFDFGVRQSGERVDSVQLPPYCLNNPRLFVLIHRQALESAHVRENIPHWIDLVFGYKQSGKAAVDAINVFHPATYCGFDISTIKDPLEKMARETMVKTYGQMPRQLFRSLHPMAQQSLTLKAVSHSVPPVLPSVQGLSWGSYVGSPADPEPVLVAKHQHHTVVADLIPLHSNDAFGLGPHTSILLCFSKEKALSLMNSSVVQNVALATWGHADSIVRIKLKKEQPPWPVVRAPELDPICVCASVPDCHQLWMGHLSGRLVVYRYSFEAVRGQLDFNSDPITLLGHTSAILKIHLSRSFSIAVSASQDQTAIIWDLNSLSYVRTIHLGSSVSLVSVSETLGDIVTVCHKSQQFEMSNTFHHSYNPWEAKGPSSSCPVEVKEDIVSDTDSPSPGVPDDWEVLHEAETAKESDSRESRSYSWSLKGLPKLGMKGKQGNEPMSNSKKNLNKPLLQSVKGSSLSLHTVNAALVGTVNISEQITAVCFSTAPEGLSVNVIATGLFNGSIRLWSSWDLSPVREISSPGLTYPIISLTYSQDSQHLYASSSDGVVAIWEGGGIKAANKTPKFFNLTFM